MFFFIIYLFGYSKDQSFIKDFILNCINTLSFIFRFFLQIIRIVLIILFYFLLHEYIYFNFSFFFTINSDLTIINFLILFCRALFELCDFFFLMFVQLMAYLIILFLFFSFLYTSKVNLYHNNWFFFKFSRSGIKLC